MNAPSQQIKPIDAVRQTLNTPAMREQIKSALPPHLSVEKFNRVAITVLQNSPDLLKADRSSLFSAIMGAAQLGLLPDQQLGESYFTAFKDKVTLIIGYRGLLKLARQSGELSSIYAELVYEADEFSVKAGTDRSINHVPAWGSDRGKIIGAYAVGVFKDGFTQYELMSIADIEDIRKNAFSRNSGAWTGIGYGEMCRKTVLRRLLKYLPLSVDPVAATGEYAADSFGELSGSTVSQPTTDESPRRQGSRLDRMAAAAEPPEQIDGDVIDAETGEIL